MVSLLFHFSKSEQGAGSKLQPCQITYISKRMKLVKNSLVFDLKLFRWGKTKLSMSLYYHEKMRFGQSKKNNCAQSANWPNSSSAPTHQTLLHQNTNTLLSTPPAPFFFFSSSSSSSACKGDSVAIVVWFEGPLGGKTQVLGLLICQLGQFHSQFIQVRSCHLLIQLLEELKKNTKEKENSLKNALTSQTGESISAGLEYIHLSQRAVLQT